MTSIPNAMTESLMRMTTTTTIKTNQGDDAAYQERLHNLRREVSAMKEEVHKLKGVLDKLKLTQQQQQQQQKGDDEEDEDDDEEEEEEEDDGAGGGEISKHGNSSSQR